MKTHAEELAAEAFEWAHKHCAYTDREEFRKMCLAGKSQTYNTALHFAAWALSSPPIKGMRDALKLKCMCYEPGDERAVRNPCHACTHVAAFDQAKGGK